jgi:hypothetical protein
MKTLFQGIMTLFNATPHSSLWTELGGQLALIEAPQSWNMPYGVFSLPSNVPEYSFTDTIENPIVQLSYFSDEKSAEQVCDIYEYSKPVFDDCRLSISGGTFHLMERIFNQLLKEPDYWHYVVQYRLIIE